MPERVEIPNKTTQLLNLNKRGRSMAMEIQLLASILGLGGENSPRQYMHINIKLIDTMDIYYPKPMDV